MRWSWGEGWLFGKKKWKMKNPQNTLKNAEMRSERDLCDKSVQKHMGIREEEEEGGTKMHTLSGKGVYSNLMVSRWLK
jgi:hypothetical protein